MEKGNGVGVYALKAIALIGKGCKHERLSWCHVSQNIGDRGVVVFLRFDVKRALENVMAVTGGDKFDVICIEEAVYWHVVGQAIDVDDK